jgi:xanthosine utilization system XapX-like protein
MSAETKKPWALNELVMFALGAVSIVGVVWTIVRSDNPPIVLVWLLNLGATVLVMLALSKHFQGQWLGLLIDNRNKISLSRLQLVAWTVMILSAVFVALVINSRVTLPSTKSEISVFFTGAVRKPGATRLPVHTTLGDALLGNDNVQGQATDDSDLNTMGQTFPMSSALTNSDEVSVPSKAEGGDPVWNVRNGNIDIPQEIWALLGLSTTSLVGATLLKGNKDREDDTSHVQTIHKNESPDQASFADLVMGEETTNYTKLDMAKIQMLYFTVALVLGYGVALGSMFANSSVNNPVTALPAMAPGVLAILGISHAGYLTNKAIPKGGTNPVTVNFQKTDTPLTLQFSMVPVDDTAKYTWDFGDGSAGTDKQPTHTYAAAGKYTVCVTARGGTIGLVSAETDVNVA